MRLVCAILLAIFCRPVHASSAVTLILQFDEEYSTKSVTAMKLEVASIIEGSGISVDWRLRDDVKSSDTFENLVVVHFHGACAMQGIPFMPDERGYYAYTRLSDGEMLPYSDVECDKVSSSIRPAMTKAQWRQCDSILGRALGRVLAHELYHMLAKTPHHSEEGITKSALSPTQLISNKLLMLHADLQKLKH